MPGHVKAVALTRSTRVEVERGTLKLELMIETPQSVIGIDGSSALRPLVAAPAAGA